MDDKRKIPYGVSNYAELVSECYFVDKTAYIRALETCKTPVFLRPKRFGKSLWCSILEHYYDINLKDRFSELFGKTDIGRNPTRLANAFLILKFDFSTIQLGTVAQIEENFFLNVRGSIANFAAAYRDRANWDTVLKLPNPAAMVSAVREIIRQNQLPPLCVIIDEYDNFTNELVVSNRDADYNAICGHDSGDPSRESFFKAFFKAFKSGLQDGTVARTYFTGVLPIMLDDISSGFNVGTVVSLNSDLLGMVGFTQTEIERYVDEIFQDRGFDASLKPVVLADLKALYDGYHFLPGAEALYNSTICNWYLFNLVAEKGSIPCDVYDANLNTDIGWFRRLAGGTANALAKVQSYVDTGEGESANRKGLSSKFGRAKFFSADFYPYALYYLGLMTFENPFRMALPNLTVKSMFVNYYDELLDFKNEDNARKAFLGAAESLVLGNGTWQNLFRQYWAQYVLARIPAQAFDKMNENFFRTTFVSRCWDALASYYSFESEYNLPGGRADFLAVPKPGVSKDALLIEFKYFTRGAADSIPQDKRNEPDTEAVQQALQYKKSLANRPAWNHPLKIAVVEIYGSRNFQWFDIEA